MVATKESITTKAGAATRTMTMMIKMKILMMMTTKKIVMMMTTAAMGTVEITMMMVMTLQTDMNFKWDIYNAGVCSSTSSNNGASSSSFRWLSSWQGPSSSASWPKGSNCGGQLSPLPSPTQSRTRSQTRRPLCWHWRRQIEKNLLILWPSSTGWLTLRF